jgi:hypothetical protein
MNRLCLLVIVTTFVTLLLGSVAHANDPLLSGYGGPGNGEQALLGSQLVNGRSGGGGGPSGGATSGHTSLRATAPKAATPQQPAQASAPAAKATPTLSTRPAQHPRHKHHVTATKARHHTAAASPSHPAAAPPAVTNSALPTPVAYPTRASSASALPLSLGDLLVAALALAALALLAVGLRRIAGGGPPNSGKAQAAL